MADTLRPWIKIWKNWLADPSIQRLTFDEKGMWLELLLLVAAHGEAGVWHLTSERDLPPAFRKALGQRKGGLGRQRQAQGKLGGKLRVSWAKNASLPPARHLLKLLPGVELCDDEFPSQGFTISFTNWRKYQVDTSRDRMRELRQKRQLSDAHSSSPPGSHVTLADQKQSRSDPPTPFSSSSPNGHPAPLSDAEREALFLAEQRDQAARLLATRTTTSPPAHPALTQPALQPADDEPVPF